MPVVVSGIGIVTPLGKTRESTWKRLLEGRSGIARITDGWEARVLDLSVNGAHSRMGDFTLMAAEEAFQQAGLFKADVQEKNIGCAVSQSKPLVEILPPPARDKTRKQLNPKLLLSSFTGWSAGDLIRRTYKLTGPASNVVAACATGIASIELGRYWIESGQCEMALVGAAESSLNQFYRAGFEQMGVLVQDRNFSSVCPFDRKRSGFVMGEGAAVMLLESEVSARFRHHRPLAQIDGVALRQSRTDSIRFDVSGRAISRLIQFLTKNHKPQYINAHGTGTQYNDEVESLAITDAFGPTAGRIAVSSTKAATGHLLGAAGAVEAAFSVLALRDQTAPPTLNLHDADEACPLDYVPLKARSMKIDHTLSLSYGFGGQLGGVQFGRIDA